MQKTVTLEKFYWKVVFSAPRFDANGRCTKREDAIESSQVVNGVRTRKYFSSMEECCESIKRVMTVLHERKHFRFYNIRILSETSFMTQDDGADPVVEASDAPF